ncbi:hypothetical protein ACFU6I_27190 [Streptomyces sp. NPDC057486]|uniref:hypothetical protein n=1 Tax=Streptomyces sp. NPDC057486 TaxID=3346145 RepID=UPI0036C12D96
MIDYFGRVIQGMSSGAVRCPVRAALLFALLLLVACHLVGALHGPGFATLPVHAAVDGCSHAAAEHSADRAPDHGGGHTEVVDHAVDRLRSPADHAVTDPGDTAPLTHTPRAVPGPSGPVGAEPLRGGTGGGQATLTRLCVLRQ